MRAGIMKPAKQAVFAERARLSLLHNPLSVTSLSILALQADASGAGLEHARPLMSAAERLSRRDLLMQLWLIEDRVRQEDVAGALRHYDRALSIYPEAEPLLFPILAGALDTPDIRKGLLGYVKARRPWVRSFLDFATGHAPPTALAELLINVDGGDRPSSFTRPFEAGLLRNAVAAQQFGFARVLTRRLAKGMPPEWQELVPSQASSAQDLQPLTWATSEDPAFQLQPDGRGAVLDIAPDGQGIAIYRVIFPTPGTYRLVQQMSATDSDGLQARWDFTCFGTTASNIASLPALPATATSLQVTIPEGCTAVRLALIVGGIDRASASGISFQRLALVPQMSRAPAPAGS